MKNHFRSLPAVAAAGLLCASGPARADVVTDWNQVALQAVRTAGTPPPAAARALAMTHLAVFDAVNAVDGAPYQPYAYAAGPAPAQASREAAATQAAYRVLSGLYPGQQATFDAARADSLAALSDGTGKTAGIALGETVGGNMLARRANDGSANVLPPFLGARAPGEWRPTAPANAPGLLPGWGAVTPFALPTPDAFREPPPPALTSREYAEAVSEVQALGRRDSTLRTAEQTEIAYFWADGAGTFTPPGHWNDIARITAESQKNTLSENARLFALLNLGMADAGICAWDMKYEYRLWRPVTAIQLAGTDDNPLTIADPSWQPLLATPPFPSYVSGHSLFSSAAAEILSSFYGTNAVAFTDTNLGPGGISVTRTFAGFAQAAEEAGLSRVYGGIHFGFDNTVSATAGRRLGQYVAATRLGPSAATIPEPPTLALTLAVLPVAALVRRRRHPMQNTNAPQEAP